MKLMIKKGYLYILLAALLWSSTGLFSRSLFALDIHPLTVSFWRTVVSCSLLLLYILFKDRKLLHISPRDIPFFLVFGLLGVTLFNYFYLTSISLIPVAGAVVLLHMSPAFAALLAFIFLKEPLTRRKLFCVLLAFLGAFLVMEGYDLASLRLNLPGVAAGLMAAFAYAGYGVCSKKGVLTYPIWTVVFYAMAFGALFLGLANIPQGFAVPFTWPAVSTFLLFGFFTGLLAYGLYSRGLVDVEASRASIVATVEVVFASLLGVFFLGEGLLAWQVVGIALVISASLLIQDL